MPYFNQQQQQPGPYSAVDEAYEGLHSSVKYILGGVGAVGGFWCGIAHDNGVPLALYVGLGLVGGLVATALLKHLTNAVITSVLVIAATLGAWFLLSNEHALRSAHAAPAVQTAPATPSTSRGLLDDLRKVVRP